MTAMHPAPPPALRTAQLSVAYGNIVALDGLSLHIPQGTMAAIVGPNGAGKSTLLRTILGQMEPRTGQIQVLGRPYSEVRRRVAYVPQRSSVDWDFPATVLDVALMGTYGRLGWFRYPGRAERQRALAALAQTGMEALAQRPLAELSGGQQQRAFLARALAQEADVLLLDEPLQGLDTPTETAMIYLLQALQRQGKTIIAIHHDLGTVQAYFDWTVLLRQRCIAYGPTTAVFTPENIRDTYQALPAAFARPPAA